MIPALKVLARTLLTIGVCTAAAYGGNVFAQPLPTWIELRPGAVGYLTAEADDLDRPGLRTVCKDVKSYLVAGVTGPKPVAGCTVRRAFGLVRVAKIVGYDTEGPVHLPIVAIRPLAGGWTGVVLGAAITPLVPQGTLLTVPAGGWLNRSPYVEDNDDADVLRVARETTVEVLRRRAPDGNYDIRVRVVDGAYRNEIAWCWLLSGMLQAETAGGTRSWAAGWARSCSSGPSASENVRIKRQNAVEILLMKRRLKAIARPARASGASPERP